MVDTSANSCFGGKYIQINISHRIFSYKDHFKVYMDYGSLSERTPNQYTKSSNFRNDFLIAVSRIRKS